MSTRLARPVRPPASSGTGELGDGRVPRGRAGRPAGRPAGLAEGISDPELFLRTYEMLATVGRDLRRRDLGAGARARVARRLNEARDTLHRSLSPALAAELTSLEPRLSDRPTETEMRLAYAGTLGWLTALSAEAGARDGDAGSAAAHHR